MPTVRERNQARLAEVRRKAQARQAETRATSSRTKDLSGGTTDKVEPLSELPRTTRTKEANPVFTGASVTNPIVPVKSNQFSEDQDLEKLAIRINLGYQPNEEERKSLLDYSAGKIYSQRQNAPKPGDEVKSVYDATIKAINEQRAAEERERESRANLLRSQQEDQLRQFQGALTTKYDPQFQAVKDAGKRRVEDAKLGLSFQGFGRSTKAMEAVDQINKETAAAQAAVASAQSLELERFRLQQQGVAEEVLASYDQEISQLRTQARELEIDAATKAAELRAEASAAGQGAGLEFLENLNLGLEEASPEANVELSKEMGFLITKSGETIVDSEGNPIEIPQGASKEQVVNAGSNGIYAFNPETGAFRTLVGSTRGIGGGGRGGSGSGSGSTEFEGQSTEMSYADAINKMDELGLWDKIGLERDLAIQAVSTSKGGIGSRAELAYLPLMQGAISKAQEGNAIVQGIIQYAEQEFASGNFDKDAIAEDVANKLGIGKEDVIETIKAADPRDGLQKTANLIFGTKSTPISPMLPGGTASF